MRAWKNEKLWHVFACLCVGFVFPCENTSVRKVTEFQQIILGNKLGLRLRICSCFPMYE